MDAINPVGAEVAPLQQSNPLQTYAGILGIKQQGVQLQQQEQNLETGRYAQQQAQAESEQADQKNLELQRLSAFTSNAVNDPTYRKADGSLDVDKFQTGAQAVAPTYGQEYIGRATQNANAAVTYKQSLLSLSADQHKQVGSYAGAVAANPNASESDLLDMAEQARGVSNDPNFQRSIDNFLLRVPNTTGMTDQQASQTVRQYARNFAVATGAPSAAESAPTVGTMQGPSGLQTVNTNPQSPLGVGPVGAPMTQGIAPHQTTNAAGQLLNVGAGGQLSTAGAQPAFGRGNTVGGQPVNAVPGLGINPTSTGVAQATASATGVAEDDNSRYKSISNAAQMAESGQNLARNVALLAQGVRTGKMSGDITDWMTTIRQHDPGLSDRQLLSKYAGQLQNMALQASGGDTDLSRGVVLNGMPNPDKMGPDAMVDASRYIGGYFGMLGARGQAATAYVQSHGGNAQGLRANADDAFMTHANPDVFAYSQIPAGKERQAWLIAHGYQDPTLKAKFKQQLESNGITP